MSEKIKGELEIDEERGVIYFHNDIGQTKMRIQGLPTPIVVDPIMDMHINKSIFVSWPAP